MNLQTFQGGQCEVAVVEHTVNMHTGKELPTFQLKYPRFIHSEFMTHRVLSRNAGSSRAIPAQKLIAQVREEPAFFVWVGENQSGMQAASEVDEATKLAFYAEWKELAGLCADYVERWSSKYNVHKQCVNRVLEPFLYISVVVTASEWDNFFELRDHEDAQPEIRDLAMTMRKALHASTPRKANEHALSDARGWHLPYVTMEERKNYPIKDLLAMSAARCARVSYLTHNKENPKLEDDYVLYKRLVESRPLHASPLEHQAVVVKNDLAFANLKGGWLQHRRMLEQSGSLDALQQQFVEVV
jgi:thymidylate synthase ThyX